MRTALDVARRFLARAATLAPGRGRVSTPVLVLALTAVLLVALAGLAGAMNYKY